MNNLPLAIAKACKPIVCPDTARAYISSLRIHQTATTTVYEATNGHCAIRVTLEKASKTESDILVDLDQLKTYISSKGHYTPDGRPNGKHDFPSLDKVLPGKAKPVESIGLNPALFATLATACKALGLNGNTFFRLDLFEPLSPMVFTWSGPIPKLDHQQGSILFIGMPVRLD